MANPLWALVLLLSLTLASAESTLTLSAWPLAASATPTPFLSLTYNASTLTSTVKSYTPPQLPDNQHVRIGFPRGSSDSQWSSVLASSSSFSPDTKKLLRVHVDGSGDVVNVGWHAHGTAKADAAPEGNVRVEILPVPHGSRPVLNKPVVLRPDGKVEGKEEEKTFLQK